MLLDKITLATGRVDFVDVQVTIWARHEKIVFSPDLVNGAKKLIIGKLVVLKWNQGGLPTLCSWARKNAISPSQSLCLAVKPHWLQKGDSSLLIEDLA